jgi:hypothetical protein
MKEKKYSLTKQEANKVSRLVGLVQLLQDLLNSVEIRYQRILIDEVFERLSIDEKHLKNTNLNPNEGELTIRYPDEKKKK